MARTLVIGTAGHIDHGKSTLVRALTGIDPDRLKEEQERGITIELGFAHATIAGVDVAFVDVPGHERFVRTMLAGAGGVDAVLLVVAADESVMPQTREHFDICRLLAIPRGIIVVTKADAADPEAVELTALEVRELVAGSALAAAPIIAVSARTGEGLDALRAAIAALVDDAPSDRRRSVARLPIDRAFSVKGFGTVVTGTLVSGRVGEGDTLELLPPRDGVRVRGVQVHGQSTSDASAPRRVAVNLGGTDLDRVVRGMTLASPGTLAVTRRVDVRIEMLAGARPLRHGARVRVHHGTGEWLARVSLSSIQSRNEDGSEAVWTRVTVGASDVEVEAGGAALARLRLIAPATLTRGDRLVLRAASPAMTIAGATVLDPEPPAGGIRRPRAADRLEALLTSEPAAQVGIWIADAGLAGMTTSDMVRRGGLSPDDAEAVAAGLVARGLAMHSRGSLIDASAAEAARTTIVTALAEFHGANPAEPGMTREAVRALCGAGDALEALLAGLGDQVVGTERLALASHRPVISGVDARLQEALERALKATALQPPDVASLATAVQASGADVQKALQGLMKAGRAQRLDVLWFHADTLAALKSDVRTLGSGATIDVAWAKATFGVSRKYAIPLLEYLDRERVTRRTGDRRVVI